MFGRAVGLRRGAHTRKRPRLVARPGGSASVSLFPHPARSPVSTRVRASSRPSSSAPADLLPPLASDADEIPVLLPDHIACRGRGLWHGLGPQIIARPDSRRAVLSFTGLGDHAVVSSCARMWCWCCVEPCPVLGLRRNSTPRVVTVDSDENENDNLRFSKIVFEFFLFLIFRSKRKW